MSGYAWAGGGRRILRVDLTGDGGKTWTQAHTLRSVLFLRRFPPKKAKLNPGKIAQDLHDTGAGRSGREKSVLEKATRFLDRFAIFSHIFNHQVWSKAVDSEFNVQPESFKNIWNLRGLISNAYSRANVSD